MTRQIHLGGSILAACLLGLLCALQLLALWRSPAVMSPALVTLSLKPGESMTLGRQELAAPQADKVHVGIRRDLAGRWFAQNESANRQLLLQSDGSELRTGTIALREGQQFRIGATLFTVEAADDKAVAFAGAGRHWRYDGATLLRDGRAQSPCPEGRLATRFAAAWNGWMPRAMTVARPLAFGGNLYCDNRLGLEHIDVGAATLARDNGRLLLASGSGPGPLLVSSSAGSFTLARNEVPLDGVTALVAGHTRLAMRTAGDRIELRPLSHVALFADPRVQLPPQLHWEWRQRQVWALPDGPAWWIAFALCGALALAGALAWQRGRWPFEPGVAPVTRAASFGAALLTTAGITALILQRAGTPPGVGVSILLGSAALWWCLLLPGRLTLVTAAGALLLAVGLLAQLELGLGAMESSWLRHFQKTAALLAIGLGASAYLRLRLCGRPFMMPQTRIEWLLALLACAALTALLMEVLFGDETGVFDLQPVEFAKLALTALTAHCIALGLGSDAALSTHTHTALRWFRLAAPTLLFLALFGLALVQVDDYSPLILLLVWSMAMAFAWSLAARKYMATAAIVCIACAAAAAIAWLRNAGAAEVSQWTFYGDRFMVWLDPTSHPHTGQQLLLGARAIAEGAWWGADHLLGISSLGQPALSALRIPQVQDDFAASFFLNRHGLLSALALWMLQALFLVGVLQTAARSYAASGEARDFRHAWMGRFRCFALCGGAAFVLGHFMISWGTNLAIFPIMGQPMSFLSAGGSHLLFFICPLLALSAISAQSFEENPSCRSMSNTKY